MVHGLLDRQIDRLDQTRLDQIRYDIDRQIRLDQIRHDIDRLDQVRLDMIQI